ncbi:MAG: nucleotidyltransferase domain-containing protein [Cyanobacteriota bacterium]|jgi:predicted nucleotidyltransferase
MDLPLSPFERLRQSERESRLRQLREQLQLLLGPAECSVWLFGSLARGDWDGFSDTDLLMVAPDAAEAEQWADQLRQALVGDDVIAVASERWQGMVDSPSPHWRAIRRQALQLHPES